jgi:hypothetical protein
MKDGVSLTFLSSYGSVVDILVLDDAQVRSRDLTRALISWFFTLAHEIAVSKLVQLHRV